MRLVLVMLERIVPLKIVLFSILLRLRVLLVIVLFFAIEMVMRVKLNRLSRMVLLVISDDSAYDRLRVEFPVRFMETAVELSILLRLMTLPETLELNRVAFAMKLVLMKLFMVLMFSIEEL